MRKKRGEELNVDFDTTCTFTSFSQEEACTAAPDFHSAERISHCWPLCRKLLLVFCRFLPRHHAPASEVTTLRSGSLLISSSGSWKRPHRRSMSGMPPKRIHALYWMRYSWMKPNPRLLCCVDECELSIGCKPRVFIRWKSTRNQKGGSVIQSVVQLHDIRAKFHWSCFAGAVQLLFVLLFEVICSRQPFTESQVVFACLLVVVFPNVTLCGCPDLTICGFWKIFSISHPTGLRNHVSGGAAQDIKNRTPNVQIPSKPSNLGEEW